MEIAIDVSSVVYPYVQVANQLREAIASGEIVDRLPSLWEIVKMTEHPDRPPIAYNTARRALNILKEEGLVETAPGRGTFVKPGGRQRAAQIVKEAGR